ncbi:Ribokinase [Hartmannibacter diazotrophicus]|uniref:Ribokinase n=1 Tax=Hartmannibacter diazotrophicus TaxID=1482074 RepID=A0A2C9D4U4_9HYPH|nr:ribokinase [Hartmannibacter diazotrophicus]SON55324.1 Ribokinase [Hartmannibacter diazotrophicus]
MLHVVGNACLDTTFRLARHPRAGETLNAESASRDYGGKGLNQAVAAVRSGAETMFWTAVGVDAAGDDIAALIEIEFADLASITRLPHATDQSAILVSVEDGDNRIVTAAACAETYDPLVMTDLATRLRPGDILLMQGNLSTERTIACLEAARRAGARALLNPSPIATMAAMPLALVDVLVLNRPEAEALTGESDPARAGQELIKRGAGSVVITLGAAGVIHVTAAGSMSVEASSVEAVDTSGAGDVFCGVLAGLMAQGRTIGDSLPFAATAASMSVQRPGTHASCPSRTELRELLDLTA